MARRNGIKFKEFMEENGGYDYASVNGERSYQVPVPGKGRIYCMEYVGTIDDPKEHYYQCSCFTERQNRTSLGFEIARWQTRGNDFGKVVRKALELMGEARSVKLKGRCEVWTLGTSSWSCAEVGQGGVFTGSEAGSFRPTCFLEPKEPTPNVFWSKA